MSFLYEVRSFPVHLLWKTCPFVQGTGPHFAADPPAKPSNEPRPAPLLGAPRAVFARRVRLPSVLLSPFPPVQTKRPLTRSPCRRPASSPRLFLTNPRLQLRLPPDHTEPRRQHQVVPLQPNRRVANVLIAERCLPAQPILQLHRQ